MSRQTTFLLALALSGLVSACAGAASGGDTEAPAPEAAQAPEAAPAVPSEGATGPVRGYYTDPKIALCPTAKKTRAAGGMNSFAAWQWNLSSGQTIYTRAFALFHCIKSI